MAAKNLRLYYNTDLRPGNTLDYISRLDNADYKDLSQHWDLQDYYLDHIDIGATWDDVKNIDLIRFGKGYYYALPVMINENNCRLKLEFAKLLTIGGACAPEYQSGMLERAHPITDNDFDNLLDEPIGPYETMQCSNKKRIGSDSINGKTIYVSLLSLDNEIEVVDGKVKPKNASASFYGVSQLGTDEETSEDMGIIIPDTPEGVKTGTVIGATPSSLQYYVQKDDIGDQIAYLRSLGYENAVIGAYQIPMSYAKKLPAKGKIFTIPKTDTETYQGENWKANKTSRFKKSLTMFNKYILKSRLSGDIIEYDAKDICRTARGYINAPKFLIEADLNIEGRPYCWSRYFDGADNLTETGQNGISGLEWLNIPITTEGALGSLWIKNDYNRSIARLSNSTLSAGWNSLASILGNLGLNAGGMKNLGEAAQLKEAGYDQFAGMATLEAGKSFTTNPLGIANGGMQMLFKGLDLNMEAEKLDTNFIKNTEFVLPNLQGTPVKGLQPYIANNFIVYHYIPSDRDIKRFDEFFTKYGYAQNCVFDKAFMNVNVDGQCYIKTSNIKIKDSGLVKEYGMPIIRGAEAELNGGVRIWHKLPSQ